MFAFSKHAHVHDVGGNLSLLANNDTCSANENCVYLVLYSTGLKVCDYT